MWKESFFRLNDTDTEIKRKFFRIPRSTAISKTSPDNMPWAVRLIDIDSQTGKLGILIIVFYWQQNSQDSRFGMLGMEGLLRQKV